MYVNKLKFEEIIVILSWDKIIEKRCIVRSNMLFCYLYVLV